MPPIAASLASVVQGPTTYAFAYNGLGDRLRHAVPSAARETIVGTPTNYTVDLAAGLTQVLADTPRSMGSSGRFAHSDEGGKGQHVGDEACPIGG